MKRWLRSDNLQEVSRISFNVILKWNWRAAALCSMYIQCAILEIEVHRDKSSGPAGPETREKVHAQNWILWMYYLFPFVLLCFTSHIPHDFLLRLLSLVPINLQVSQLDNKTKCKFSHWTVLGFVVCQSSWDRDMSLELSAFP
jgi:hypothetical protein